SARATAAGLDTRPLSDTVADVLAWDNERGSPTLKAGLSPEREAALLAEWHRTQTGSRSNAATTLSPGG
ncbi:MAG TPA: hypothetical protein VKZ43_07380, partial [Trueperaceae bacterium]|nr:hypothetical protein [Trueperaceae bacterium]